MERKRIAIDRKLLSALHELSETSGRRLDKLLNQALRDFLKSQGQPVSVEDALKESTRRIPANDTHPGKVIKRRR
ncbi:hypothetical protein DLM45_06655 [Hyphomicrobium methylovorum]|uniref:hypothetical protein n=1 Tax=Hyphomicrobium methylovorum TaxID=84 RepID=UPI0015E63A5B|nr:hypothetical protein [Hyphomicrobium methylovorum]MBA2125903.1 hypothetical protein [Hyphomicrobium methylovorum]